MAAARVGSGHRAGRTVRAGLRLVAVATVATTAVVTLDRPAASGRPVTVGEGAEPHAVVVRGAVPVAGVDAPVHLVEYSATPLFAPEGPRPQDVRQGAGNDCTLLAMLAGLAAQDPEHVRRLVVPNDDGSYAVQLFDRDGRSTVVTVTAELWVESGSLTPVFARPAGALWPAVVEKAFFALYYGTFDTQTSTLGDAGQALHDQRSFAVHRAHAVHNHLARRAVIVATTHGDGLVRTAGDAAFGYVGQHAYAVVGTSGDGVGLRIAMYNPWGAFEPFDDGHDDGLFTVSAAEFDARFRPWDVVARAHWPLS